MSAQAAVLPILVLAATVLTAAPAAEAAPHDGPASATLRVPGYAWTRTVTAPGLDVYAGSLTRPSAHPSWTVTIFAPTVNDLTGQATTAELGV